MKLLSPSFSSSSSSSSSSTILSFDTKSATASCIAGILRRILCSRSLPTYPTDHVTEDKCFGFGDFKASDEKTRETNPGLVARLMGLESMPETNFLTSVSQTRSTDEVLVRRVKSAASFREIPEFIELEDKEFFVLSFESVDESGEFRPKGWKSEAGFGEVKQRRRVKGKRDVAKKKAVSELKRDSHNKRTSCSNKAKDSSVSLVGEKIDDECQQSRDNVVNSNCLENKEEKVNHDQVTKCEDSSPVSVLDCGQFLVDPKVPISGGECNSATSSSRRKLSLETVDSLDRPSLRPDDSSVDEKRKSETKQGRFVGARKKESESPENSNVLDEICWLSEAQVLGASWVQKWTFDHEDYQGISEELEALILCHLLEELVHPF